MAQKAPVHVLVVSFPAQGHVSPLLRLGMHLAAKGCYVTFATTQRTGRDMQNANNITTTNPTPVGDGLLGFEFFHDGLGDDVDPRSFTLAEYSTQLELFGCRGISEIIKNHANTNRPINCIINNPFVSWVCDVAHQHNIPCALYWIHSASTFVACYHYFKKLSPFPTDSDPYVEVQLPEGIFLKHNEIPEFLHPFSCFTSVRTLIARQFENLSKTFCVVMDTFEELEQGYLNYLSKFYHIRPVGPLLKNPTTLISNIDNSNIQGDFYIPDDCMSWLNSKPHSSVVYISLGTIATLTVEQIGEFAYGLLDSEVSFLWVLGPREREGAVKANVVPNGFFERSDGKGKVVQWSPQEQVLAHPSVACYLSHCGWNSTVEALASGVPMLAFSQLSDQVTNAKFIIDVYGVGIKVWQNEYKKKEVIGRDEIKRMLFEVIVGAKGEELKRNALKWKALAEAAKGGSSDRNLVAFVEDIKKNAATTWQEK